MPVENPRPLSEGTSWRSFAGGLVLLGLLMVFVTWLALSVQSGLESLEDKLDEQSAAVLPEEGTPGIEIVEGQTVYVPVYSHINADGGKRYLLETTLSIRNTDPDQPISIKSVKYFGTDGEMLREFVDGAMPLAALATAEFLVEKQDVSGGSGANFIVQWDAEEPVYEPLIEAVMVGFAGPKGFAFTSPGRVLADRSTKTGAHKE